MGRCSRRHCAEGNYQVDAEATAGGTIQDALDNKQPLAEARAGALISDPVRAAVLFSKRSPNTFAGHREPVIAAGLAAIGNTRSPMAMLFWRS